MTDAGPLRAVMFFVEPDQQEQAAHWYRDHVLHAGEVVCEDGYWFLECGGVEVGFHPADPVKNPQGGSVVAYFASGGVESQRQALLDAGAKPHRGPLRIADDRAICQLVDPFGNVLGLDGQP